MGYSSREYRCTLGGCLSITSEEYQSFDFYRDLLPRVLGLAF